MPTSNVLGSLSLLNSHASFAAFKDSIYGSLSSAKLLQLFFFLNNNISNRRALFEYSKRTYHRNHPRQNPTTHVHWICFKNIIKAISMSYIKDQSLSYKVTEMQSWLTFSFWKKQVWSSEKVADSTSKRFSIRYSMNEMLTLLLLSWQIVSLVHMKLFLSKRTNPTFFFLGGAGQGRGNALIPPYTIQSSYCHCGKGSWVCWH